MAVALFAGGNGDAYAVVFNVLFAVLALGVIYAGYISDEAWLVNLGVVFVAIDLVARYFDFFWSALPRSVGMIGAGLVVLGIASACWSGSAERLLERMAATSARAGGATRSTSSSACSWPCRSRLAGLAEADLAFGEEIRLRAQPVDPLDVFRGNYVVLTYEMSNLPVLGEVRRGERVCARLREEDGFVARELCRPWAPQRVP